MTGAESESGKEVRDVARGPDYFGPWRPLERLWLLL